jgi:hypothetical protein
MIVAGAVFAVIPWLLMYLCSEAAWVGHASILLEFVILDAPTGEPLDGASVRQLEGIREYDAASGGDGRAKIVVDAMMGGRSSLVRKTRFVNYAWALSVTCGGHESFYQALSELTQGSLYHSDPSQPPSAEDPSVAPSADRG